MLKSFKNLKERNDSTCTVVIDCRENVLIEHSISSLKSIFSSLPNTTPYVFLVNDFDKVFDGLVQGIYQQETKADISNSNITVIVEPLGESKQLLTLLESRDTSYYCFLRLGVIVSPTFLGKMTFCYKNFKDFYESGTPGLVLPVFNGKVGNQHLTLPPELEGSNILEINNRLIDMFASNEKQKWIVSGLGCDVCYVISKEVVKECGFPDFSLKTKHDGTTMITQHMLKLLQKNFVSIISGDTYVFFPEPEKHLRSTSQFIFNEEKSTKKLAVMYKIHIRTEFQLAKLAASLVRMSSIADKIYIKDCSSSQKVAQYMKMVCPNEWAKVDHYEKFFSPIDDKRDYNAMLEMAENDGCDWVLALEGIETFPAYIDRTNFDKLMNPPHNGIFGYAMSEFYMWDAENWRFDGIWLNSSSVRLSKIIPGRRILGQYTLASQVGYVPVLPKELLRFSNVPLLIWTFSTPEEREEAYKFVKTTDPTNDYRYFQDERNLQLYPLKLKQVSTYSPSATGGDKLNEWLEHIWSWSDAILLGNDRDQIPDESVEIAKNKFGAKVITCSMEGNFAEGRNTIIEQAKTDFIFQLDIDERIIDARVLLRLVSSPHQAHMFSIDNLQKNNKPSVVTNTIRLFNHLDGKVKYWGLLHETIDDSVRKFKMSLMHSPVKLLHYGYFWATDDGAYKKMQRYIGLNLKQMEAFPNDPRSYYNLAMHLIEDQIYDTAFRCLNLCVLLSKGTFVLPVVELTKLHLLKSLTLCAHLGMVKENTPGSKETKEFAYNIHKAVSQIISPPVSVAPNHANNYFLVNKSEAEKLNDLLYKIEKELKVI